jgi:prolyl-tRNA synthetase
MTHSDDQGLVLPPTVAPEQVVVVPIWQEETRESVLEYAGDLATELDDAGIRVEFDDRDERNPGFKYNEWELKGVPVRLEVGPNEVDEATVTAVHRPDGETVEFDRTDAVGAVHEQLDDVYAKLYAAAEANLDENVRDADSREEILGTIGQHGGYVRAPWCGDEACEAPIKDAIAAEIVLVPLEDDTDKQLDLEGTDCAICDDSATETAFFAKTY